MAGNQDGSKGMVRTKHSSTLEIIGRQEGRGNGMTDNIFGESSSSNIIVGN
jgi:hypothetical protein